MNDKAKGNITVLLCDIDLDYSTNIIQSIDALCTQTVLPSRLHYVSNKPAHEHKRFVAILKKRLPHNVIIENTQINNPSTLLSLVYSLQKCKTKYLLAINHNCVLHGNCLEQLANISLEDNRSCLMINVELVIADDIPSWIRPWLQRSVQHTHDTIPIHRYVVGMLYTCPMQLFSSNNNSNTANNVLSDIATNTQHIEVSQQPPLLTYRPSVADLLPFHIFKCAMANGYAIQVLSNQLTPDGKSDKSSKHDDILTIVPVIKKLDTIIDYMQKDISNIQQGKRQHDVIDPTTIEQLSIYHYQLGHILACYYPPTRYIKTIKQLTQYLPLTTPTPIVNAIKRNTIIPNRYRMSVHHLRVDKYVRYHILRHRYIPIIDWCLIHAKRILRMTHSFIARD